MPRDNLRTVGMDAKHCKRNQSKNTSLEVFFVVAFFPQIRHATRMQSNIQNHNNSSFSPNNDESKKLVVYSRISREKGGDSKDISLDNQKALAADYARLNGMSVIGEYTEIQSAKKASNRPEFQKAIAQAKKEKAVLFLYSLSRGFRSTTDALLISQELGDAGADLVSWTEKIETHSPSGKMFFTIVAAMNTYEREILCERTKSALAHKKRNGEKTGGSIPFGYRVNKNGKLIVIKSERATVKKMVAMRTKGKTYKAIAEDLNAKKILSKTGRQWAINVVRRIVIAEQNELLGGEGVI
jgi:DNA invertase Pin-like site-specific DNA recombinase